MTKIIGTKGDDYLQDTSGNDLLKGKRGDDTIRVTEGENKAKGGSGDDVLIGLGGTNVFVGGSGEDLFLFDGVSGHHTVKDFTQGEDQIGVGGLGISSFQELLGLIDGPVNEGSPDTKIEANGVTIILKDIVWTDLTAEDFGW